MENCDLLVEEFKTCIRTIQDISIDYNYQFTRCNFIWKDLVTCFNKKHNNNVSK